MTDTYQGTPAAVAADQVETLAALRGVPGVHAALVTEHTGDGGRRLLVGYVTGVDPALGAHIRDRLTGQLPDYLLPDHLVVLDELPLTPDGDYDLGALPLPRPESDRTESSVGPRTPTERRIAGMIEQLLSVSGVGVHDSFFALGGSSILATRLAFLIREAFEVEVSLPDVLASPTVDELARLVGASEP